MKRLTRTKPGRQPLDAESQGLLRTLTDVLIGPDDRARQALLHHLATVAVPAVRRLFVDPLIQVLRRSDADKCRRAGEALVAIGPPAVYALLLAILRGRNPEWQVRLADVLA